MGLFDFLKKKKEIPGKLVEEQADEKTFEDFLMEVQSDMVSICLEYVENKADKIYIYGSFEANTISCTHFYEVQSRLFKCHELSVISPDYDVSIPRQRECMHILTDDMKKLIALCEEHQRPMPTEMKLIYDVKTNHFDANYQYEPVYSGHSTKLAHDIAYEWMDDVAKGIN